MRCASAARAAPHVSEMAAHRAAGAALETMPSDGEQVRARLDFDQSSTVGHTAPSPSVHHRATCSSAPLAGQERSWRDDRASEEHALEQLEAEWALRLQAPLDELLEFEHTVSRAVTELQTFLARV